MSGHEELIAVIHAATFYDEDGSEFGSNALNDEAEEALAGAIHAAGYTKPAHPKRGMWSVQRMHDDGGVSVDLFDTEGEALASKPGVNARIVHGGRARWIGVDDFTPTDEGSET
jgi:hypothetical protein